MTEPRGFLFSENLSLILFLFLFLVSVLKNVLKFFGYLAGQVQLWSDIPK